MRHKALRRPARPIRLLIFGLSLRDSRVGYASATHAVERIYEHQVDKKSAPSIMDIFALCGFCDDMIQ